MAIVRIYIEGGTVAHANDAAATVANTLALREAFYKLFNQRLGHYDFNLELELGGGWVPTRNSWFKKLGTADEGKLLVDLDRPAGEEDQRLLQLNIEQPHQHLVYFMVQEMETFFLSQPAIFNLAFANRKRIKPDQAIADDDTIAYNEVRDIRNPAGVVNTILGRYYRIEKRGKGRKQKYGSKLREGALLLERVNLEQLTQNFPEMLALVTALFPVVKIKEEE